MSQLEANAHRMVQLFAWMRTERLGPAFVRLKQLNLSLSHMRALQLLAEQRALAMKELAEQMKMTPPSVTALTRRLVETELVQRTTPAGDSRVVLLSLTDQGRRLHEQVLQEHVDRMAQLLQGLSDAEQEQFLDLLERAVRALQAATPIDSPSFRVAILPTPAATPAEDVANHAAALPAAQTADAEAAQAERS